MHIAHKFTKYRNYFLRKLMWAKTLKRSMSRIFLFSITGIIKYIDDIILYNYHSNVLICYSVSELLSNYNYRSRLWAWWLYVKFWWWFVKSQVSMICCETTMLLRSHPIISISPIGFRHYNTNIYRAVPFFTLWLPSRHSPFRCSY